MSAIALKTFALKVECIGIMHYHGTGHSWRQRDVVQPRFQDGLKAAGDVGA
jgi:hypothetical protein